VVGLIGSNGAGKTTFINMVTGYLKPTSGSIHYDGRDITGMAPRDITRLGICRSFQIPQLFNTLSAYENPLVGVGIALRRQQVGGRESPCRHSRRTVDSILERFNLTGYRDKPAGVLPGKVCANCRHRHGHGGEPKILLLDEPTWSVGGREVRVDGHGHGSGKGATGHGAVRRARHGHHQPLYPSRAGVLRGPDHADGEPGVVLDDAEVRWYVTGDARCRQRQACCALRARRLHPVGRHPARGEHGRRPESSPA
jgi:branched-chain amino acid transport system ATP-binding protein